MQTVFIVYLYAEPASSTRLQTNISHVITDALSKMTVEPFYETCHIEDYLYL